MRLNHLALALTLCLLANRAGAQIFDNEPECIYQGGICVLKEECPPDSLTSVSGLCPKQQSKGVECCYELPTSLKTCEQRGGICMPKDDCHLSLNPPPTPCPDENDKCCPLV